MKNLEKLVFYSLLVLIVWLPVPLGSNRAWAWSIAQIWIALQTVALIVIYWRALPWNYINKYSWLLIPIGLFQVWVAIQSLVLPKELVAFLSQNAAEIYSLVGADNYSISLDRGMTTASLLKGISYFLLVFNATLLVNSGNRLKSTALAIVIAGTGQAFYAALVVKLGITESLIWGLPEKEIATGSFVYKNHLANYLIMSAAMGVGLIISQLHISESGSWIVRFKRILSSVMSSKMLIRLSLVIMVIALVLTRSRMGNAAFFVAITVTGLFALAFYRSKPRALTVLIVSILLIDTFVVGALFGLDKVKQRLVETSVELESRDQVVMWSLDIIKDYPLTGTGLSTFYTVFPGYSHASIGFYDHAHNDYVQFAVEVGVPATLMLGLVVLYALFLSLQTVSKRNSHTMKGIAFGSAMAIIGVLIHISVDFNLQPMANAATFIMILFFCFAASNLPARNEKAFIAQRILRGEAEHV
ncbi:MULTISPECIES: O-antigen ligase family protein [Vibrio]|uniref:Polymerase n=1 Tax=Vibrio bivalvicida TaxID=1276888 RepID=A0A177Y4E7_9VIBR|nr:MULTISPECIES: O-antigen ligase family protein [Vibrio]KLN63773.1 polymerase [Vibrio sp. VPAP30]OAJ95750.1 polymerase [Vibrio bivalvicida]